MKAWEINTYFNNDFSKVNCWYVDFEGDITAVTVSSLHVYIGMLKAANKFMEEHEDEEIKR